MGHLSPEQQKQLDAFKALPVPDNSIIHSFFINVDRVVIKKGGVFNDKPMGEQIGLIIEEKTAIETLESLLQLTTPPESFSCMCLGNHSFELYSGSERKAVFALHHNENLRIWGCSSDAPLLHPKELVKWLAEQGYDLPLLENKK